MTDDLLLQHPAANAGAAELLLLFHGVGAGPQDLRPLGNALAQARPQAWVVAVQAPTPSDLGRGWQWFSVQGVTEANRPARVAAALPAFAQRVAAWQRHTSLAPPATTLLGFSQGAIMALASTQADTAAPVAGRVLALAGRLAQPPQRAPVGTTVHLLHGNQDGVMPVAQAVQAFEQLQALGATVTLDRFDGLGHGIDARVLQRVLQRLAGTP